MRRTQQRSQRIVEQVHARAEEERQQQQEKKRQALLEATMVSGLC